MWKLPFNVLGAEAYSDIVFDDLDEVMTRFGDQLRKSALKLASKRIMVGRFLILRHQIIALPSPVYDQRNLWVEDVPGFEVESDRPTSIQFQE